MLYIFFCLRVLWIFLVILPIPTNSWILMTELVKLVLILFHYFYKSPSILGPSQLRFENLH